MGTAKLIEFGHVRVAVLTADEMADSGESTVSRLEMPVAGLPVGGAVAGGVEFYRAVGGNPQSALIFGSLAPPLVDGQIHVEIQHAETGNPVSRSFGAAEDQLVSGIPREFAPGILTAGLQFLTQPASFRVLGGAWHAVESSSLSFLWATGILIAILGGPEHVPVEDRVQAAVDALKNYGPPRTLRYP